MNDIRFEMVYSMFIHTKSAFAFLGFSFKTLMQIQNDKNGFKVIFSIWRLAQDDRLIKCWAFFLRLKTSRHGKMKQTGMRIDKQIRAINFIFVIKAAQFLTLGMHSRSFHGHREAILSLAYTLLCPKVIFCVLLVVLHWIKHRRVLNIMQKLYGKGLNLTQFSTEVDFSHKSKKQFYYVLFRHFKMWLIAHQSVEFDC